MELSGACDQTTSKTCLATRCAAPSAPKSLSSLKPRSDFTALATVEGTARLKFLLVIFFQAYLVPSIYTRQIYIAPGLPGERSERDRSVVYPRDVPTSQIRESGAGWAADCDILKFN